MMRYLVAVRRALECGSDYIIAALLLNGVALFSSQIPGVHTVAAAAENALRRVLVGDVDARGRGRVASAQLKFGGRSLVAVRRAALTWLSDLLCLPNAFSALENRGLFFTAQVRLVAFVPSIDRSLVRGGPGLTTRPSPHRMSLWQTKHTISRLRGGAKSPPPSPERKQKAASSASSGDDAHAEANAKVAAKPLATIAALGALRGWIGKLVVDTVRAATDAENTKRALWLVCCKVLEDASSPGIAQITISVLTSLALDSSTPWGEAWSTSVRITALAVLREMAAIHAQITVCSTATLPMMLRKLQKVREHAIDGVAFRCVIAALPLPPPPPPPPARARAALTCNLVRTLSLRLRASVFTGSGVCLSCCLLVCRS